MFPMATDSVATDEATSSGAWGDLGTVGPTVTVNIRSGSRVLVMYSAAISASNQGQTARASLELTGANTHTANDGTVMGTIGNGNTGTVGSSKIVLLTGLNPGNTTFTMKYRRGGSGTANFSQRDLVVIQF